MMVCTAYAVASIDWQTVASGALSAVIVGALLVWLDLRRDLI